MGDQKGIKTVVSYEGLQWSIGGNSPFYRGSIIGYKIVLM